MSRPQFEQLKNDLKTRSAGAFVDGFYYMNDHPSSTGRHRPTICVICVFQRVPEGSSWARSRLFMTPAQRRAELERNPNAPRIPVQMLHPSEEHLGWTSQDFDNYLQRICYIPLQFLCFVIHKKLWPAVMVDGASHWAQVILQPQFWKNQWLFHETNNGELMYDPRVASKVYTYFRRNDDWLAPMQDYTLDENQVWSEDWRNWQINPPLERHIITLLRALLLSDPNIVEAGYNENPAAVDVDFLNTPLSWNSINTQGGSDLEYPYASQLRHMNAVQFENGYLIHKSTWYIAKNYAKLAQYRFDSYWLFDEHRDPETGEYIPAAQVSAHWDMFVEDLQQEWNDIFLHHSIFRRAQSRNHEDFLGINPNVHVQIAHRNQGTLSLMRSMYPNFVPPSNPNRSRPVSYRLQGRGIVMEPAAANTMGEEEEPSVTRKVTTLSDYVFFHMRYNNS